MKKQHIASGLTLSLHEARHSRFIAVYFDFNVKGKHTPNGHNAVQKVRLVTTIKF